MIKTITLKEYFEDEMRLQELMQLAEVHRLETEETISPEVYLDLEAYRALESTGSLIALGAFTPEAVWVGYACAFLSHSFHYGHLVATNDALFVLPQYRAGGYGVKLMKEMERLAKARGAKYMFWQAKPDSALNLILERRGCKVEEIVYLKEL